jgi:hypothetical protein
MAAKIKVGPVEFETPITANKLTKEPPERITTFGYTNATTVAAGQNAISFTNTDLWIPTRNVIITNISSFAFRIDNTGTPFTFIQTYGRITLLANSINAFPPRTVITPSPGGLLFPLNDQHIDLNIFIGAQTSISVAWEIGWAGTSLATDSVNYNINISFKYA